MILLKKYAISFVTASILIVFGCLVLRNCEPLPAARLTMGVMAEDFPAPTRNAMRILNRFTGCEFLVAGDDIKVLSTDGEPCGESSHPSVEDGHSASAYQCGGAKWEIHVEKPGDLHTQVCIVGHEIGHVAGLEDHDVKGLRGIMDQHSCPTPIGLSDKEAAFLHAKFCF